MAKRVRKDSSLKSMLEKNDIDPNVLNLSLTVAL